MPKVRVKRHTVIQPQDPSYRLIPLTQGQNAIVDTGDFEWLNQWNWHAEWSPITKSFYARRHGGEKQIRMNSAILCCEKEEEGDHINHNTLDNRRQNLRKSNSLTNSWNRRKPSTNSSGFVGVSRHASTGKWRARIGRGTNQRSLGLFFSVEDAARAYNEAAKERYGEFAVLNEIH